MRRFFKWHIFIIFLKFIGISSNMHTKFKLLALFLYVQKIVLDQVMDNPTNLVTSIQRIPSFLKTSRDGRGNFPHSNCPGPNLGISHKGPLHGQMRQPWGAFNKFSGCFFSSLLGDHWFFDFFCLSWSRRISYK